MEGSLPIAWRAAGPGALLAALILAGCGGGARQDAHEPSGTYRVDVVQASFPARQHLAAPARMVIAVRNSGPRAVPDVAVTLDAFTQRSEQAGLADPRRAVWIVDDEPRGGVTAYTSTWALGRVAPGQTRRFVWRVVPVKAGTHRVRWQVAAGLNGKARATVGDAAPGGTFTVDVSATPTQARVDPRTGRVVRERR